MLPALIALALLAYAYRTMTRNSVYDQTHPLNPNVNKENPLLGDHMDDIQHDVDSPELDQTAMDELEYPTNYYNRAIGVNTKPQELDMYGTLREGNHYFDDTHLTNFVPTTTLW